MISMKKSPGLVPVFSLTDNNSNSVKKVGFRLIGWIDGHGIVFQKL